MKLFIRVLLILAPSKSTTPPSIQLHYKSPSKSLAKQLNLTWSSRILLFLRAKVARSIFHS